LKNKCEEGKKSRRGARLPEAGSGHKVTGKENGRTQSKYEKFGENQKSGQHDYKTGEGGRRTRPNGGK